MEGQLGFGFSFRRPGPGFWTVFGAVAVVGVVCAGAASWVSGGGMLFETLVFVPRLAFTQPWRLLTSGLVTSPGVWSHLVLSLLGFYLLGLALEKQWGSWRFVRFVLVSILLGNLTTLVFDRLLPIGAQARFHPDFVYGPGAALVALCVAWAREFPDLQLRLFFIFPMKGRTFFWLTLAFCVLDLVYPEGLAEGVLAPFGGLLAGQIFAGSPSLSRRAWLLLRAAWVRVRLAMMRSRGRVDIEGLVAPKTPKRSRPSGPPLRVVPGGLEDVLKKRTPPKDKRYLN
jgi:membrane associated rhomboid family serine protease